MTLTQEELRKLIVPLLAAMLFIGAGVFLVSSAREGRARAQAELLAAQGERKQNTDRLALIAEDEREVTEKLDVYKQLKRLNIRNQRELLDLTYRVDRQKLVKSLPGKPGTIDFFASTMHVQLDLLHEGDLLRFLGDLRDSGNAYYAVKSCSMRRTGQAATGATITPRLRGSCEIDLITVVDRGAKR